jgi:methylase of polypeptide subunit release factors
LSRHPAAAAAVNAARPGSGAVTTALAALLHSAGQHALMLAIDINRDAAAATRATAAANGAALPVEVVCGDLCGCVAERLRRGVDVVVCNPPYVPTPPEEVGTQ